MKILKVYADLKNSQEVRIDKPEEKPPWMQFRGLPVDNFESPVCYVHDERQTRGNFFDLAGILLFDQIAHDGLKDIVEKAGQVFPIDVEGAGQLYLLNVVHNLDVLDEQETERVNIENQTAPGASKILMFDSDKLNDSSLFKVSSFPFSATFTYQGKQDSSNEFIGRYNELGLTGLEFRLAWSDES